MLWAYIELLQSFRRPQRPLDWIAFVIPFILGSCILGGGGIVAVYFAVRYFGNFFFVKLFAGFAVAIAGWVSTLVLNVQLFRLVDWIYDSWENPA
jgi:hypothetical protein